MAEDRIESFQARVRRESHLRTGKPIPTSTPEQAAFVIEMFFSCANDAVRIVTGSLNARIYGTSTVIVEAKKFLADKRRALTVVFLNDTDKNVIYTHPLLSALRYNSNLHIRQSTPDIREKLPFHFCLVDSDTYRFKRDVGSHGALTAFGDEAFASQLLRVFSYIEQHSERFPLRENGSWDTTTEG